MVFLRPVVMRDVDSATKLSLDRYDFIRARQKEAQPVPSAILQINESPVLPQAYVPPAPASSSPATLAQPVPPPPYVPPPPVGAPAASSPTPSAPTN